MREYVEFVHGAFCDPYEEQARKQGYTLGDKAELMDKLNFGLTINHVHGCLTDAEYVKALRRLQKNLFAAIKPLDEGTDNEGD